MGSNLGRIKLDANSKFEGIPCNSALFGLVMQKMIPVDLFITLGSM